MSPAPGGDLARRLATAALALPLLLAAPFLGPPWLVVAVVAAASLLGMWEFMGLMTARGLAAEPVTGALILAAVFTQVAYGWPGFSVWPLAALLAVGSLLWQEGEFAARVSAAAATLLGAVYLGGLGGAMAGLALLPPVSAGPWRLVLLLAIIMVADSAAYFAGRALGRRKLAPSISPGKTWEGALAGLLGGVLGALAVRALALPALPPLHAALLGVAVAVMGMAGDLAESLLKRWAGVKDSGSVFPGHGGMLDRLDSLLFGAPVLYYYFNLAR
ncbi:MAG TPA: phosphatidate cytidylyltransferase [Vicinamibacteria bacterium]|nr:phosphatidate cytidylyltransferase [Vicinamibacteria bacterium]